MQQHCRTVSQLPIRPGGRMPPADTASPIQTRRMSFEASLQEVPRHFGPDGDLLSSHIAACLSAVFPDGEDFFVRSVQIGRHTSELQSLMRISYAVLCLKKKTTR